MSTFKQIYYFFKYFALHFDRSFSKSQVKQIYWLTGITCVVFAFIMLLSLIPVCYNPSQEDEGYGRFFDLLFVFFDPGNATEGMSGAFIFFVALIGNILFIGCLISVFSNILNNRVEQVKSGETWYKLEDHVVIIGYNGSVPSLVHSIYTKNERVRKGETFILIMSEQPSEDIRAGIHVANSEEEENCVLIIRGQRTAIDELEKLQLHKCSAIYLLGEPNEEAHDSINMECLATLAKLMPEKTVGLPDCNVQFDEPMLFSIFQFCNISQDIIRRVNFIPYNFCDVWSQKVLVKCEAEDGLIGSDYRIYYRPIDGEQGIKKDSDKHVHIVITSMSQMGIAMGIQAAHIAHFPNFKEDDNSTRTHITFIAPDAEEQMNKLMVRFRSMFQMARRRFVRIADLNGNANGLYSIDDDTWIDPLADVDSNSPYKHLGPNFIDLQWEFIEGESDCSAIQQYYLDSALDKSAITSFIFADDNQDEALRASLYMPNQVYDTAHQILVYQDKSPAIVHNLSGFNLDDSERMAMRYHAMNPFGMNTEFHIGDLDSEKFGRLVNVAYSYNPDDGIEGLERQLSDAEHVEKEWNSISMANKWSSTYSANMRYIKLRFIGCDLDKSTRKEIENAMAKNIEDIKRTEHNRWNVEKLLMGFRPLRKEEVQASKEEKKRLRKSSKLAHLDICSYADLAEIDPGTIIYDASVNMALPIMVEIVRNEKKKN